MDDEAARKKVLDWLRPQVQQLDRAKQAELLDVLEGRADETAESVWKVHDALSVASEIMGWEPDAIARRILKLEPEEPTGPEVKRSKLAAGVEERAIAEKLTAGFQDTPEYEVMNVREQSELAAKLVHDDLDKAIRIAMGEEQPGGKLRPESVFVAVENHAIATKDVDLMRDLAVKSTRSLEATDMGQRIRMLAERNPDSAVSAIQKVAAVRKAASEKKNGAKAAGNLKAEINKVIRVKNSNKKSWTDFVTALTCK